MRQFKSLDTVEVDLLQCYVLRHRWQLRAGLVTTTIVDGDPVIEWDLECTSCGSHATEMRDAKGKRFPGTARTYDLHDDYRILLNSGWTREQAFLELRDRTNSRV